MDIDVCTPSGYKSLQQLVVNRHIEFGSPKALINAGLLETKCGKTTLKPEGVSEVRSSLRMMAEIYLLRELHSCALDDHIYIIV